jgi:hypothetical protein
LFLPSAWAQLGELPSKEVSFFPVVVVLELLHRSIKAQSSSRMVGRDTNNRSSVLISVRRGMRALGFFYFGDLEIHEKHDRSARTAHERIHIT